MRTLVLAFLAAFISQLLCYYAFAAPPRVIVEISGRFSSDPNEINVDGNPGPFPLPSLLGGSFVGSFEYRLDAVGVAQGYRDFPYDSTLVEVFGNTGELIHTITLPTSGERANPLKVGNGHALFYLGPSFHTQSGHVPRMPTDIRFDLVSSEFSANDVRPPNAAMLNSASLGNLYGYGPFVELDATTNPFHNWDLRIISLSVVAREVPESSAWAFDFAAITVLIWRRCFWLR